MRTKQDIKKRHKKFKTLKIRKILLWGLFAFIITISIVCLYVRIILQESSPARDKTKPNIPHLIEGFEPDQQPTRNSGTWARRGGVITVDRMRFEQTGTVQRIFYDVRRAGGKLKEAGWWCGLAGMDLRGYSAFRFKISFSNSQTQFLVGFKNVEWLEQKLPSADFIHEPIVPGKWIDVVVPLDTYKRIDNWTSMDNFSLTFRSDIGKAQKAEVFFDGFELIPGPKYKLAPPPAPVAKSYPLPKNAADLPPDQLLDIVQHAAFDYFPNNTHPTNGLVKDLCRKSNSDHYPIASTAAVGYGMSSLCVGVSRGWISDAKAKDLILKGLKFYRNQAEQEHGFFYHFLDLETGERWEYSEVSSVDTAILLAGMLTAANYYPGTEIEKLAREIYRRVDWNWMLGKEKTLCMGWTPEDGFLTARWSDYCELMVLYLLAIGSDTHPIPSKCWYQWSRLRTEFDGENFIACPPLFTHQVSHIWVDFRGMQDEEADYFENSIRATRANKKWCQSRTKRFKTYKEGFWGLSASDGPTGYMAYGAPYGVDDGTVTPTAAISSIVFTPEDSVAMIRLMLKKLTPKIWGPYGFVDAFNLELSWFSNKYIGIDQGPIVLMIENYRTGLVWKTFMKEPAIQKALKAVKFK